MRQDTAGTPLGDELAAAIAGLRVAPDALEALDPSDPSDPLDGRELADPREPDPAIELMCGATRVVVAAGESIVIGRSSNRPTRNDVGERLVGIDHPMVSRRHALLRTTDGHVIAEDAGSRNGTTLIRGDTTRALVAPTKLIAGDRLCTVDGVTLCEVGQRR